MVKVIDAFCSVDVWAKWKFAPFLVTTNFLLPSVHQSFLRSLKDQSITDFSWTFNSVIANFCLYSLSLSPRDWRIKKKETLHNTILYCYCVIPVTLFYLYILLTFTIQNGRRKFTNSSSRNYYTSLCLDSQPSSGNSFCDFILW